MAGKRTPIYSFVLSLFLFLPACPSFKQVFNGSAPRHAHAHHAKVKRIPEGPGTTGVEWDPREGTSEKADHKKFVWPIHGRLAGLFGPRGHSHHDGIDIMAQKGSKIVAADDGEVVFNGRLHGYGNLIVIRHKGDYFTAYAHNSANLVKKGKKVKRGKTVIAKVGRTGNATTPHLHFEVRYRETPRNPLFYLPKEEASR